MSNARAAPVSGYSPPPTSMTRTCPTSRSPSSPPPPLPLPNPARNQLPAIGTTTSPIATPGSSGTTDAMIESAADRADVHRTSAGLDPHHAAPESETQRADTGSGNPFGEVVVV